MKMLESINEFIESSETYVKHNLWTGKKYTLGNGLPYIKLYCNNLPAERLTGMFKSHIYHIHNEMDLDLDEDVTVEIWFSLIMTNRKHRFPPYNDNVIEATEKLTFWSNKLRGYNYSIVDVLDVHNASFFNFEDAVHYKMINGGEITDLSKATQPADWEILKTSIPYVLNYYS